MTSKFALVIANTEYQDASFAKLTAPGKDAEEFAQVLRDAQLAGFDDVQTLINEAEGKTRRAIARFFADRKRDDLLLLYFSGHGIRNGQGQLFLATNDTEIKILEATGIPAEFITYSMNNSRSQRQLLILDCCNSGAFAYGSKSAAAVGKSMGIATAFEGSGFGRVVLTATDATQYAWEGDKVIGDTQKSVFTHYLIEGLKGDADRDSDGRINVDELYDYAYEQVVRRTPKQTPGKWSYKQQGDIVLRENLKPSDVKPAPLPPELLEMLSQPSSSVRRAAIQDLTSLLDGKHPGLARAAQEKLREIAEHDDSLSLRRSASDTLTARRLIPEQSSPLSTELPKEVKKIEMPRIVRPRNLLEQKKVVPNLNLRLIGGVAGGVLILSFLIWGASKLLRHLPGATPAVTSAFQTNMTFTSQPVTTTTSQPEPTDTPAPTQTSVALTPTSGISSTMTGEDGMTLLYVQAGEFKMGSNDGEADEKPIHTVNLDAFWIDQTEVTNAMYAKCVQDANCSQPSDTTRYDNSDYANHPVVFVSWNDAETYCSWAHRRLPTEAEWEKAARGTAGRTYPWGNKPTSSSLLNYNSERTDETAAVGSYPEGASPYGALDMAGNVWEWVADWYNVYPGGDPTESTDFGQTKRVMRGGSWTSSASSVRSANRGWDNPTSSSVKVGFRCAMSATP